MRRRWTFWRGLSALIAVTLFACSVTFFVFAHNRRKSIEEWSVAKPIDMKVDLSQPGEFVGRFHQTWLSAHSQFIGLRVPEAILNATTPLALLKGASARFVIADKSGVEIESSEIDLASDGDLIHGLIPLSFASPGTKGDFSAKLVVTAGAAALKGVPQRLEGRYLLCGMEEMPVHFAQILAIATSVLGGLVGAIVLYRLAQGPPARRDADNQTSPAA